jgi:hypothetical protein
MQPPSIKPVRTIANPRIPIAFLVIPARLRFATESLRWELTEKTQL